MAENSSNQWLQIKDFLKKAGDDMKRVGEDIKTETTRLVEELRDPEKQAKAKEKLSELGVWAKSTAQGAADLADAAMKKIEERMSTASDYVSETLGGSGKTEQTAAAAAPKKKKPAARKPTKAKAKPAKKTIGKKKKA
ncbi:MAG: hypothetical protein ACJ790_18845 [Myxococcaceae bacterium]